MNINILPYTVIGYLVLTLILELLLSFILGLRKQDLLFVALVNIITNPILNLLSALIYISYNGTYYLITLIVLEILAFITEGLIYIKVLSYKKIKPILLSLILNMFSFAVGTLINLLI